MARSKSVKDGRLPQDGLWASYSFPSGSAARPGPSDFPQSMTVPLDEHMEGWTLGEGVTSVQQVLDQVGTLMIRASWGSAPSSWMSMSDVHWIDRVCRTSDDPVNACGVRGSCSVASCTAATCATVLTSDPIHPKGSHCGPTHRSGAVLHLPKGGEYNFRALDGVVSFDEPSDDQTDRSWGWAMRMYIEATGQEIDFSTKRYGSAAEAMEASLKMRKLVEIPHGGSKIWYWIQDNNCADNEGIPLLWQAEGQCGVGMCITQDRDCDDANPCTEDVCMPNGCRYVPVEVDDGNSCTHDWCDAEGVHHEVCSGHGICHSDDKHDSHCMCDFGYVGERCTQQVETHFRWENEQGEDVPADRLALPDLKAGIPGTVRRVTLIPSELVLVADRKSASKAVQECRGDRSEYHVSSGWFSLRQGLFQVVEGSNENPMLVVEYVVGEEEEVLHSLWGMHVRMWLDCPRSKRSHYMVFRLAHPEDHVEQHAGHSELLPATAAFKDRKSGQGAKRMMVEASMVHPEQCYVEVKGEVVEERFDEAIWAGVMIVSASPILEEWRLQWLWPGESVEAMPKVLSVIGADEANRSNQMDLVSLKPPANRVDGDRGLINSDGRTIAIELVLPIGQEMLSLPSELSLNHVLCPVELGDDTEAELEKVDKPIPGPEPEMGGSSDGDGEEDASEEARNDSDVDERTERRKARRSKRQAEKEKEAAPLVNKPESVGEPREEVVKTIAEWSKERAEKVPESVSRDQLRAGKKKNKPLRRSNQGSGDDDSDGEEEMESVIEGAKAQRRWLPKITATIAWSLGGLTVVGAGIGYWAGRRRVDAEAAEASRLRSNVIPLAADDGVGMLGGSDPSMPSLDDRRMSMVSTMTTAAQKWGVETTSVVSGGITDGMRALGGGGGAPDLRPRRGTMTSLMSPDMRERRISDAYQRVRSATISSMPTRTA